MQQNKLQVVAMMCVTTILQALTSQSVDVMLAFCLMVGGTVGAQFGASAGKYLRGDQLRALLALLVLGVAIRFAQVEDGAGHLIRRLAGVELFGKLRRHLAGANVQKIVRQQGNFDRRFIRQSAERRGKKQGEAQFHPPKKCTCRTGK